MPRKLAVQVRYAVSMFVVLFLTALSLAAQELPKSADRITASIDERNLVTLKGSVPRQARAEHDRGTVGGNLAMDRIVLVLKRSDAQEKSLNASIQAMHEPSSPHFHQWLTPAQFGNLYGPSDADLQKLTDWLRGSGFQAIVVAPGRGTIEFSGTADLVSNAFHTSIHQYVNKGESHYANSSDPSIPAAFSPVVSGILSLHNFVKQSSARIAGKMNFVSETPNGPEHLKPDVNFTSGAHGMGPGDLWTIYNETPLITAATPIAGTGQTVAIAGRSDVLAVDITAFRKRFLPAPYATATLFTQTINGPDPGIVQGDFLEQTLDVEYSTATAPGAQINLVVSGSTNTTDGVDLAAAYIVNNNLAPVMSTSYGLCEALMGPSESNFWYYLWQQAAAQGITSLVSSGDNGSAGCDLVGPSGTTDYYYVADEGLQVSGLSSTPFNVSVGGNLFTDDTLTYWSATSPSNSVPAPYTSALSYIPETTWNESCSPLVCGNANATIAAGSGGKSGCLNATLDANYNVVSCSGGWPQPDWQTGVNGIPADGARHMPDVSLNAAGHDGYVICYNNSCANGGTYVVGGTSGSSPAFAGIMALVNQKTGSRQGQANYTLYRLAATQFGTAAAPTASTGCLATNGNTSATSCIFHDIVNGTNAVPCDGGTPNCSSPTVGVFGVLSGYAAGVGYDSATGLGSVNITNLVNKWSTITSVATSTTLTIGSGTSTFGQPVPLNVKVSPATGSGTPTGLVAIVTDSTLVGAQTAGDVTLAGGAYSGTISSLPGGTYHVSARYAGDTTYSSSISTNSPIVVAPAASSAALSYDIVDAITGATLNVTPAPYGSIIAETATIKGVSGQIAPAGNVAFTNGGVTLATQASDGTGVASNNATKFALGTYSLSATFAGNSNYKTSIAPAISVTVGQAGTTLRLTSTTSYVIASNTAKLTAIVGTDSLLANPTGTVTFLVGGVAVGTSAVANYTDPSSGASEAIATFAIPASALSAGANTITASYGGDGNYIRSVAPSIAIGYSATAPINAISLAASTLSVQTTKPVTLVATVTTGGIPATAGTVNFFDGKNLIGAVQMIGSHAAKGFTTGTAVLKPILFVGSHSITATYTGVQASPNAVTSTPVIVTVTGNYVSTVALAASPNATVPTNYDLTATVNGYSLIAPTGAVDFTENTVLTDFGSVAIDPKSATHTFLAPRVGSAGSVTSPSQSVVADFNGDGIPDLAITNANNNSSTITVYIGNGDGTFQAPAIYAAGSFAYAIAAGDFNGDGILDLAVSNQYGIGSNGTGNGFIGVYLGNGDGTFQPQTINSVPGSPVGTVIADLNHDGFLDFAIVQYAPNNQMTVEFGNGDGTFQIATATTYPISTKGYPYWVAAADFNGDGAIDLVEVNGGGDSTADVFLNSGTGTFTLGSVLTTGASPQWVSIADVNGDGKPDILTANYSAKTVSTFLGNGDGTFAAPLTTAKLTSFPNELAIGDLNGDGIPDMAVEFFSNPVSATGFANIGILTGNGDGTFGTEVDYPTGQLHGFGITMADLNGDGAPDLISVDLRATDPIANNVSIFLNVTKAVVTKSNVSINGPINVQQEVQATYAGDAVYNSSASAGVFVNSAGSKAAPVILWTPASTWGVGLPLGASVLNASIGGLIAGSFSYSAQSGTGAAFAVIATSTLPAGTYTITATFTPIDSKNYSVATATRTVVIAGNPDFAIQSNVPSLTIVSGKSGTLSLTATSLYGFTGQIALGNGTLPGGFSVTASPSSVAVNGTSTITIQTSTFNPNFVQLDRPGWKGWTTGGGITLACLCAIPFVRRRHRLLQHGLVLVLCLSVLSMLSGCAEGYSNNSIVGLVTSSASAASGSPVTLTATLSGDHSSFGGTVTFYAGSTLIGSPVSVNGNTATLNTASLPVGLSVLSAIYAGDQHNAGGTSNRIQQLITGTTNVELTATAGSITHSTHVQVTLQ